MSKNGKDIESLKKEIKTKRENLEELKEIKTLKEEKHKLNKEIDYHSNLDSNLKKEKRIDVIRSAGKMVGLGFKATGKGINATFRAMDQLPGTSMGGEENSKEQTTKKKKGKKEKQEGQSGQDSVGW